MLIKVHTQKRESISSTVMVTAMTLPFLFLFKIVALKEYFDKNLTHFDGRGAKMICSTSFTFYVFGIIDDIPPFILIKGENAKT